MVHGEPERSECSVLDPLSLFSRHFSCGLIWIWLPPRHDTPPHFLSFNIGATMMNINSILLKGFLIMRLYVML